MIKFISGPLTYYINREVVDNFTVTDFTGNLVPNIDPSEFTWNLYDPTGLDTSGIVSVYITELSNGSYRSAFTPDSVGSWYLVIFHSVYFPWGKSQSYWILDTTAEITVDKIVDGIEQPDGKLDSIYEKLPDNKISDSHDTTSILDTVVLIDNKIDNLSLDTTSISTDLKRVLGLVHENIFIDMPIYDDSSNLISARLRIYSTSSSVGTDSNIIGTYLVTADGNGPGKFNTWKQIIM